MSGLVIEGVVRRRGRTAVLQGVDIHLAPGRILALLGPSGCGKTTLLRLLAGFDRCDGGTISLDGTVLDGPGVHVPSERRAVGYVPQEGLLFPHLSVAGNVAFGLSRADRRAGRVADTLHLVGLDDALAQRQPQQLSGGQQQRVALARALAPRPRLVLLDEPFNGLDGGLRRRVAADTAAVLREAGATVVLVTHDPGEAFAVADRIAVLQEGRVAQNAEPSVLYRCPSTLAVARLTGPTVEVSGEVCGSVAETALGRIPVLGSVPDGRAMIVLRPEQVRMTDAADGCPAEVVARSFAGSHTRVTARVAGQLVELQVADEVGATGCIRLVVDGSGLAVPG